MIPSRQSTKLFLISLLSAFLLIGFVHAQEEDFFADDDFSIDSEDVAADSVDAVANPAVEEKLSTTDDLDSPEVRSPAVNEVLAGNPTTPGELVRAIDLLGRLDRSDLAIPLLKTLAAQELDDQALANLHREYGSALLLRIARNGQFAPEGNEFVRRVFEATNRYQRDPVRLKGLLTKMSQAETRNAKLQFAHEIFRAGPFAVSPIMSELTKIAPNPNAPLMRAIIRKMGDRAAGPLLAFLQSDDELTRVEAINLLGDLKSTKAIPALVRPLTSYKSNYVERQAAERALRQTVGQIPDYSKAKQTLITIADRRYEGQSPAKTDGDGFVDAWIWDAENKSAKRVALTLAAATMVEAGNYYRDLREIDPGNYEFELRHLTAVLESEKSIGGLDQPLRTGVGSAFELAKSVQPHVLEHSLERAMVNGHPIAAIAAAEVLGELGSASLLDSSTGQPRPLAQALTHANPRIRIEAANAIVKLKPISAFPGTSHFMDVLAHTAGSLGRRRALVVHPRRDIGRNIVGFLEQSGFVADAVTTSEQFLRSSICSPDYELFLISDAVQGLTANHIVQHLRRNPRTNLVPVGLMSRNDTHDYTAMMAGLNSHTISFAEPVDAEALSRNVVRLMVMSESNAIPAERRGELAVRALDGLLSLADTGELKVDLVQYLPLIQSGMYTSGQQDKTAKLLGFLGSPDAQRTLVDLASSDLLPLEQRTIAAKAFQDSVDRFGVLLTKPEVINQYARYNASRTLDETTQDLLGSILDLLEARL